MADNTTLNAGSGGDTFAADDIGGIKYARSKITLGADSVNDGDVSSANPMPIAGEVTVSGSVAVTGTFWQATQPVSAASLPLPSGASTAANQATANSSLGTLAGAVAGTEMQVDIVTSALPSGAATEASLALAVTALQIIDNIVSGSEAQVDIVAALPAGDAAIGRVKLTNGTNVADVLDLTNSNPLTVAIVDGSGTQITSFGGGTQYTEGDTDASITGTAVMWEDAANTLVAASGAKPLPVEIIAGAGSGGTAAADDADFTAGTTSGTPVMGVFESSPTTVTDGDLGVVGITIGRQLKTYDDQVYSLIAAATTSGTPIATEVTLGDLNTKVTACNTGAVVIASGTISLPSGASTSANQSTIITSLQLLDDAVATTGSAITTKGFAVSGTDGTNARVLKTDSSGELQVDIVGALPAGTNAIGKLASNTGVTIGAVEIAAAQTLATVTTVSTVTAVSDAQVQGKAAQDAAASGNPVLAGAVARRARITAMSADGDAVSLSADRYGRLNTVGIDHSTVAVQATASGDTALVAAPGAGNRLKILRVKLCNSHASTALTVGLKTAAHNSGSVFEKNYLPALGGQAVVVFPLGHLLCGDNEAFNVNLSGAGQIECTVYYETIAN